MKQLQRGRQVGTRTGGKYPLLHVVDADIHTHRFTGRHATQFGRRVASVGTGGKQIVDEMIFRSKFRIVAGRESSGRIRRDKYLVGSVRCLFQMHADAV